MGEITYVAKEDIIHALKFLDQIEPKMDLNDEKFNEVYSKLNWLNDEIIENGLWDTYIREGFNDLVVRNLIMGYVLDLMIKDTEEILAML